MKHPDLNFSRGFSLIEVLVALIVLSVGLLGIAKMQALAISSTSVASSRSLAAIQAASMAAAMHANRGYWTSATSQAADVSIVGKIITNPPPGSAVCTATSCSPEEMAAYDVGQWTNDLNALLANPNATIKCIPQTPPACRITVQWTEKTVASNGDAAAAKAAQTQIGINTPKYELYVEP
jgi:type IV pilus assembly protein PilV